MLTPRTVQLVKSTAPVVADHAEAITTRFYHLMFAGNPEVQAYFNPAHQRSGGQQRALAGAICAYAASLDNLAALGPAVELIAQKHCSLGIQPDHYPIVGRHLLAAIHDILGDSATEEVIGAWREAYELLAGIFIKRETQIYQTQSATPGGWNGFRRFRVERKQWENEIITSFYLRPQDNGGLATFKPGQYITVKVSPPQSPTSPRNYSLSDRPGLGHYRISVKRELAPEPGAPDGLASNFLHDHVVEGDVLDVGPACGEFTLSPLEVQGKAIALISGGIGITPVLSMLKSLAHHRVNSPVVFIHAARNSRFHAFADEVKAITAECANVRAHFRYDAPLDDDIRQRRCDSAGFVDAPLLKGLLPSSDTEYFFCGPKPFMVGLLRTLKELKVRESQMHYEFFGPKQAI